MRSASPTLRIGCAALSLTCLLGVSACSGGHHKPKPSPSHVVPSPTPTPTPTKPTAKPVPKPPTVDPLVGGKPTKGSVVAVKIDDTAAGRPQAGIDQADIVYIERVEGGLTRAIAVFHSRKPIPVGPVRSVRSNDPELLSQYGHIAFVVSGGGGDSLPALDRSILRADINDRGGPGFYRDGGRPIPYNLMLDFRRLPPTLGRSAKFIGFTWSTSTKRLVGTPKGLTVRTLVGGTPVQFDWSPSRHRYLRLIDGVIQHAASGAGISTPNVIVQFCKGHVNRHDIDQAGNPGFYTESIGAGRVVVFRNGHRVEGRWARPSLLSGTTLRDRHGKAIPLAPGGAWVILVDRSAPLP